MKIKAMWRTLKTCRIDWQSIATNIPATPEQGQASAGFFEVSLDRLPIDPARSQRALHRRGSALLAVLWLSAALAAITFAVANTVRGESERTSTAIDGVRSYYLATGSIDRAILHIEWGAQFRNPDGTSRFFEVGMPVLHYEYPTGVVDVEVIPEAAKLNVNYAKPEDLFVLLQSLGVPPEHAQGIAAAIVDWRTPAADGLAPFDLAAATSFRPRHASFEEIEELMMVRGITPDLFYGRYARDGEGRLRALGALRDAVSVYGSPAPIVDVNTATPAVLRAVGLTPDQVAVVINVRNQAPIRKADQLANLRSQLGQAGNKLRIGGNSIVTLRATARLRSGDGRISDMRRSVAAVVKLFGAGQQPSYQVLRWYDDAWRSEDFSRP